MWCIYRVWHKKQSPKKTKISRKRLCIFCCIFHQLMARYIAVRHVNFIKIHNQNYGCAKCKCYFVSEQQLISSITRNWYCFNYRKETRHVDASNINSDSMFEMSNGCFLHVWSLLRNDSIAALIWALRQANPDRLHIVLLFRKCRSALVCNIGTSRELHLVRDNPVD